MTEKKSGVAECREIDLAAYPRRRLYEAFRSRTVPVFSITTTVEITALRKHIRARQLRFYATLAFLIARAANEVPEFRHRIVADRLVEFDHVHPSLTALLDNDTFSFADADYTGDFAVDYASLREAIERAKQSPSQDKTDGRDQRIFLTNLPWFGFSSIHHPYEASYASIPVITTGKILSEAGRETMPLGVQVHHGLVDGLHIGRFVEKLSGYCAEPEKCLPESSR